MRPSKTKYPYEAPVGGGLRHAVVDDDLDGFAEDDAREHVIGTLDVTRRRPISVGKSRSVGGDCLHEVLRRVKREGHGGVSVDGGERVHSSRANHLHEDILGGLLRLVRGGTHGESAD